MNYQKKERKIEIVIIVLLICFSTFIDFILWAYFDYFNEDKVMNESQFRGLLLESFKRAFVANLVFVVGYYINKNRIKKGKKPW